MNDFKGENHPFGKKNAFLKLREYMLGGEEKGGMIGGGEKASKYIVEIKNSNPIPVFYRS